MSEAYKGYLIRHTLGGETFIEKGGQLIGWAADDDKARETIDMLTEDAQ